jgi:hypothetical protein
MISIQVVTFLIGLALIVIGIFGGGIEVKEIRIPTLPALSRALSSAVGLVLVILCLAFPQIFPSAPTATTLASTEDKAKVSDDRSKVFLGAAIQNHLITVQDVKRILRHLGKYSGPITDEVNDAYFQAVAEFQISQNIDADGLVGPVTYGKLREAWPDFFLTAKSAQQ